MMKTIFFFCATLLLVACFSIATTQATIRIVDSEALQDPRHPNVTHLEYDALVSFYLQAGGAHWTDNKYWLDASYSPCLWYGVTCDQTAMHIASLDLPSNNLVGTISEEIGGLFQLISLDLSGNQLTGPIPGSLSKCLSLGEINLSRNALSGAVPDEIGPLLSYSLKSFDASFNQLTGSLPDWIATAHALNAEIVLNDNPFACPLPVEHLFTGAKCVVYAIDEIQPSCLFSSALTLVWGGPWPQNTQLLCSFLSVNTHPGFVQFTTAEMINPNCLSCNVPNLGTTKGPNNYYLDIYLESPFQTLTNYSTFASAYGSASCPSSSPGGNSTGNTTNIRQIQRSVHQQVFQSAAASPAASFLSAIFLLLLSLGMLFV